MGFGEDLHHHHYHQTGAFQTCTALHEETPRGGGLFLELLELVFDNAHVLGCLALGVLELRLEAGHLL